MPQHYPAPLKYKTARAKALEAGLPTYTGRKCPECHAKVRDVKNGRCVACREAGNTYYSRHTEEQKDKMREQSRRKWRENRLHYLVQQAKYRAKRDGRDFDLTVDDLEIPETCPVLGIPMTSPSLDRKDNSKGYVKGNVFVISRRANILKNDATVDELEAVVRYMKE